MGITQEAGGAKLCDCCESAAALLYCGADSAFMCVACDARVHTNNNNNNKHERFWMCEVCERAPASVTCKADAASMCVACDRDIHWANPLAGRHDRVPVVPFYGATTEFIDLLLVPSDSLMPNQEGNNKPDLKSMELLFQDSDQFLNFDQCQIPQHPYGDSIVPVRASENRFTIDFAGSSCYSAPSLSHSVSSSSIDVGVVPDGSEISYPFARNTNSGVDNSQISQVVGMDREARVLRYREKRKNRKFEKTIRYASRKAYAEIRPRIKGRFAKKTDGDSDFGVIPSF